MADRKTTILAVTAGAFGSLDSALNIAFPDLSAHFDLEVSGLQWVVVCFVLAYGGPLLAAGQLADLIDELRLWHFPVVTGPGKRLFGYGLEPGRFDLASTTSTQNGVVHTTYQRVG